MTEDELRTFAKEAIASITKIAEEAKAQIDAATQEATAGIGGKTSVLWEPKIGQAFYHIDSHGAVNYNTYLNYEDDLEYYTFGNCFKTRDEAEEYARRLKYNRIYEALGRPFSCATTNFYAYYDHFDNKIKVSCANSAQTIGVVYFAKENDCLSAISTIGKENFIRYVLSIRDGGADDEP